MKPRICRGTGNLCASSWNFRNWEKTRDDGGGTHDEVQRKWASYESSEIAPTVNNSLLSAAYQFVIVLGFHAASYRISLISSRSEREDFDGCAGSYETLGLWASMPTNK